MRSEPGRTDLVVGDFVLVKFETSCRSDYYIGMVEKLVGDAVSARFLRRVRGSTGNEKLTFSSNENDLAVFAQNNVPKKLPQPKKAGGTARRWQHFMFLCNLEKWCGVVGC